MVVYAVRAALCHLKRKRELVVFLLLQTIPQRQTGRDSRRPMNEAGEKQTVSPLSSPIAGEETQVPEPQSLPDPPLPFDPSRMIGIIKRKGLIKELTAVYHAQCLSYCQQLLELQKKSQEPFVDLKAADDSRKETMRPPKRLKKSR